MKALGAGTALGVFGGVASADELDQENGEPDEPEDGEDEPDDTADDSMEGTVHVVRTLIAAPTNPDRPADFFYQPTGLHVEPGDIVKFVFETPDHTVTSYHPAFGMQRRIPSGTQPFSSPLLGWDPQSLPDDIDMPPAEEDGGGDDDMDGGPQPSTWIHSFETPGVYDLECAPHEAFGMAMRIVVGDETETTFETSDASALPPPREGPVDLSREVLTDPNLEPDAIVEEGRVEWLDLEANQGPGNGDANGDDTENGDANGNDTENGDDMNG